MNDDGEDLMKEQMLQGQAKRNREGDRKMANADPGVQEMLIALARYRHARVELLGTLRPGNREPLVEWSERLVAELLGGTLAESAVQKDWDVKVDDQHVQVRYLANSPGPWVNEHRVTSLPGVDRYALVVFDAFVPQAVIVFPNDLTAVCKALGKKHPDQDRVLQFTQANYWAITRDPDGFNALGVETFTFQRDQAS